MDEDGSETEDAAAGAATASEPAGGAADPALGAPEGMDPA